MDDQTLCQVLHLIDVSTPNAATITFLERHNIILLQQHHNSIQVSQSLRGRQRCCQPVREVMTVGSRRNTDLNIEGDQANMAMMRE